MKSIKLYVNDEVYKCRQMKKDDDMYFNSFEENGYKVIPKKGKFPKKE